MNDPEKIKIEVFGPHHEREPGYPKPAGPPEDWEALKSMTKDALLQIGMRPWGAKEYEDFNPIPGAPTLWLFPAEWYSSIPAGLEVVDIFFNEELFQPDVTDDDTRYGMLAFGIYGPDFKDC